MVKYIISIILFLVIISCSDIKKIYIENNNEIVIESLELWNDFDSFDYMIVYKKAGADLIIKSTDKITYNTIYGKKHPKGIHYDGIWDTIKYIDSSTNKLFIITHELGHWLGYDHNGVNNSVMHGRREYNYVNFIGVSK